MLVIVYSWLIDFEIDNDIIDLKVCIFEYV